MNSLFAYREVERQSEENFSKLLRQPTPKWMEKQIDLVLSRFSSQLSKKYLDKIWSVQKFHLGQVGHVRVKITNGQLSLTYADTSPENYRVYENYIRKLYESNRLPVDRDVDFIICIHDIIRCNECHKECIISNGVCVFPPSPVESPTNFEPIFVQADCRHYHNIIFPSWTLLDLTKKRQLMLEAASQIPWKKKKEVLFFRGGNTDQCHYHDFLEDYSKPWFPHPRAQLVRLSLMYPNLIDAKLSGNMSGRLEIPNIEYQFVPLEKHCEYKYLMDLDGTCASNPRNMLIMFTGSLIFKAISTSIAFQDGCIKPYKHFIPVKNDLSDLLSQLEWARQHDKECQIIAKNALNLAKKWFRREYLDLYVYRLIEAYAKKQAKYYDAEPEENF